MKITASLNNFRMSPRKTRLVVDLVRGMNVNQAKIQLNFLNKKAAQPILKLLNSAIANAKNNFKLNENNLYISEIFVNEGRTLKRWRARAMGRSASIKKRTSNIEIALEERASEKRELSKKDDKAKVNG